MAEDYDNTDKGAAFPPFEDQKMILQGKLNSNGNDYKIVLVKDVTKNDKKLIEVYAKIGVLFENETDNDKAPAYTGPLEEFDRRLAAWRGNKDGRNYLTMKVSDDLKKEEQKDRRDPKPPMPEEEIPF